MKDMKKINIILVLCIALSSLVHAKKEKKVDHLNLGGLLVKDGYYTRANETLKKVNIEDEKFDFAKFYMLKGLINQKIGYPNLSNIYLDEAIKNGQTSESLYLYMARNYWSMEAYPKVIEAIKKAGESAKNNEMFFIILAESYKRLENYDGAFKALDEGLVYFKDNPKFYRQKFYYLMELGFYKQALIYARKFLEVQKYSTKDYLAVSLALRENKLYKEAAILLEEAVLRTEIENEEYPKLIELLSQVYIDNEQYTAAALVLDQASVFYPKFAHRAATLYLKSKIPVRSFQLNRRVIDQKEKFKQRVGIDIYLEDFESLVAMESPLKRYGVLKEDNMRYALGFGYFRVGDFKQAKFHLKQVQNPSLFEKATYIFEKIEKCEDNPLECRL
jgi:tetratricopeptide (TPR) repeat protein